MIKLLVIDDDGAIQNAFRRAYPGPDSAVLTALSAAEGLELVANDQPDVIILDLLLPDQSGLEVFRAIREIDARIPVIFITGRGTATTAIEAMKLGAFDYLLKPLDLSQVRSLIAQAFQIGCLARAPVVLAPKGAAGGDVDVIVGRSLEMQKVFKAVGRVAAQDVTVLVLGESGTGKELVARAIYQHSRRSDKPFMAINCAAIPDALLESELFGHEKGAFTDADRKRIGKFEQCSGGTIFLDEIGDMSPLAQTKVLRVLQDQQFERVGGHETVRADVRLIAATNRDLKGLIDTGLFRGDLYYRLSVFTIELPPLRERPGDIPLLVDHFVARFAREFGKEVQQVAPETIEAFSQYPWPGNLRELQSVLKQSLLISRGPTLSLQSLPKLLKDRYGTPGKTPSAEFPDWESFLQERLRADTKSLYHESLALMERLLIIRVLRLTKGNQVQAAKILGITRGSLRSKIRAHNLTIEQTVWSEDDQPDR